MRRNARIAAFFLAVSVPALGASAAAAPRLTLAQAQQMALTNHPDVRAAQFDVTAAREAIAIVRSAYAPQVVGSAVSVAAKPDTRIGAPPSNITDPTILQRTAAGLSIAQYITDFGRTAAMVRSYEAAEKAQAARGEQTQLTVTLDATQAYFQVLRTQALLRVAQQTLSERDTLLHQTYQLMKAGLRSTLDTSIAQRDVSTARQAIIAARAAVEDARATLSDALGSPVETDYTLQDMRALPALPTSIGPLIDEMLASNPELSAMNEDLASARARERAIARQTSPTVMAYGYFGGVPIRAANQAINQAYATAGVAMNVPIFNGGDLAAQRRQAVAQTQVERALVDAERDDLLRDTRIAYEDVQAARGNIAATEDIVSTAATALRLTQARYRIGLNSIVDVSVAELSLTQAKIDHTNAVYDYIEQGAGLEFLTGALVLTG